MQKVLFSWYKVAGAASFLFIFTFVCPAVDEVEINANLAVNGNVRGNSTGGALRISTEYGYVDVGPTSSYWCHFSTDRARFYMNKELRVNTGLIGAYNTDLSLTTGSGTTRMIILNSTGRVGIATTNPGAMLEVYESSTSTTDCGLIIRQDGTGDSKMSFKLGASTKTYSLGIDNSYGDAFVLSKSSDLGTDRIFEIWSDNTFSHHGDVLPYLDKTYDLGMSMVAWDNVFADDFINQGMDAFSGRLLLDERMAHPLRPKHADDFDAITQYGTPELDPRCLPEELTNYREAKAEYEECLARGIPECDIACPDPDSASCVLGIKVDEMASYNYRSIHELLARVVVLEQIVSQLTQEAAARGITLSIPELPVIEVQAIPPGPAPYGSEVLAPTPEVSPTPEYDEGGQGGVSMNNDPAIQQAG